MTDVVVKITPTMLDKNGRVDVWLIPEKKWRKCWPIDAKEIVALGAGSLEGPEPKPWPDEPAVVGQHEMPVSQAPPAPTQATEVKRGFPEPVKTTRPERPGK